jgi:Na+-translocating ferredoxin:NAD+ oxidoreductase RnfC subunit
MDCFECGACAYVCPSHIPLVQYFRVAKRMLKKIANKAPPLNGQDNIGLTQ